MTLLAVTFGLVLLLTLGVMGVLLHRHRTVTELLDKKIEELRRGVLVYKDIFDRASDIIYIHSLDGNILKINTAPTKLLGFERHALLDKPLKEISTPDYQHEVDDYLRDVQEKGESTGLLHLRTRDGEDLIFEYQSSIITKNAKPMAVRGIARNVTQKTQAEQALQEGEGRFRLLLKFSPIPIAVQSGGRWVYVNDAGIKLLGAAKASDIIGKRLLYFVKSDRRKVVKEQVRAAIDEGNSRSIFIDKIMSFSGTEIEAEITAMPIIYGGRRAGQVAIRDLSERKRLSEELERAQRLETAGRIAGQIAHDFNNLLAPLTAYPTLMREDLATDHPAVGMVDEIESAAKKIAEINQQLLALGRRGRYSKEFIDLNELFHRTLLSLRLPDGISVETAFSPDLLAVRGGAAQLTRAFTNLILNAREAMQDIGTLEVITRNVYLDEPLRGYQTIKRGEYVRLDIQDTGTGIDPAILDKIFDPFYTTKTMDRVRGSGLGLSIVHGVLEDHGGYVTIDSSLGQGTTFSLYFPISRDEKTELPEMQVVLAGRGERVLLVDDDPIQRSVVGRLLKRLGYAVSVVESGEEAVERVRKQPQDLLVLDMVLEGIDGAETFRQILSFNPSQKAIILSGYAISERVEEALQMGAGAFVSKPITSENLAEAIRKELDKKSSPQLVEQPEPAMP